MTGDEQCQSHTA